MKALCIIDVQEDYVNRPRRFAFPKEVSENLIEKVNEAIDKAQKNGTPVMYVRQVHASFISRLLAKVLGEGLTIKGVPGAEIASKIKVVSNNIFDKEWPSAFSSKGFAEFIRVHEIDELVVTGLDGCFCVNATSRAALKRGIRVSLIEPAIASSFPNRWITLRDKLKGRGAQILQSFP